MRNAMVVHAAFGGSTNLLLHIPAIAYHAGLRRPTVDDWNADQPPGAAAGRCAAQRPDRPSDGARLPGRRRAGGDAAPAPPGPARRDVPDRHRRDRSGDVLDWWETVGTARTRCASCCATRTASIPTTVIMSPEQARAARPDQHRHLPARQPRAGRLGHQEHGHRSVAWSMPTASIARSGPARVFTTRDARPSRRSRATAPIASSRATCWC